MIELDSVTKRFPGNTTPAIEDVDLAVGDGELLGLVGLNGAGKSTLIRVTVGLSMPTSGVVRVQGYDMVHDKARASATVGWVPESFPFDPSAKALALLVYYAGFNGIESEIARSRARELLSRVGLETVGNRRIRTFSQGMKRRFGLAAVMLTDPSNLLLDEPLNGLDPEGIAFVREWVLEQKRSGKSILLSSHLLAELQAIADRIAFIHEGHVIRTISHVDLARISGSELRITVENLDATGREFLNTIGAVREEENAVFIRDATMGSAQVTAELVRRGYRVAEIWVEGTSLETYFLQMLDEIR